MKTLVKTLVVAALASAILSPAIARAQQCTPGEMLVQVKPGLNPDGVKYRLLATVGLNDDDRQYSVTQAAGSQQCVPFPTADVGQSVDVMATFQTKKDVKKGTVTAGCSQSYTVVSPGSIGCGPIEVYFQAVDDTCVIICN
jgi:hypothetical protein